MPSAIGYVRVSTDEQAASGLGLTAQRDRIAAYCALRGLELAGVEEDAGVSGGTPLAAQPGGRALVRGLRRRGNDHVVMLKLDRGFRNAADCLATVESWERRGTVLHVIDLGGNAIDTSSAAGKFMLTVLAGAAEMERNLTRERTRAAMQVKRSRGERISGHAPLGYRFDTADTLRTDPDEQVIVAEILEGHGDGLSLRQIAARLQELGMRGCSGTPLSPKTVRAVVQRAKKADAR